MVTLLRSGRPVIAVLLLSLADLSFAQGTPPDLILYNGKIFTSSQENLHVQALAISGERITAIGDSAKIKSLAGPHTKEINLGGRTVIPGINDAHNHLGIARLNHIDVQLGGPIRPGPKLRLRSPPPCLRRREERSSMAP